MLDHRTSPATDMRSLYRILRSSVPSNFIWLWPMRQNGLRVSTTIAQRFRTSVEQFSSYCNVDEPFHSASDGTNQVATPSTELPTQIHSPIDLNRLLIYQQSGFGRVLNHSELDFTYVDREIIPTRTAGNATFTDGQPATAAKRLDWLLANRN